MWSAGCEAPEETVDNPRLDPAGLTRPRQGPKGRRRDGRLVTNTCDTPSDLDAADDAYVFCPPAGLPLSIVRPC